MPKISPISGFPEWLPEQKLQEDSFIRKIRDVYQSYGFVPIETPAVEWLDTLTSKGVVDKELYAVRRLKAEDEEADLALHFDLTVPFSRYVAQHLNSLTFPFKRYQLQKVWRGERPQKGRFREFYQFDVDIIARDELPLACDAEVLTVIDRAFRKLGIGPHRLKINSRKVLIGFYSMLGLSETQRKSALIAVDKLAKIGTAGVVAELKAAGISESTSEQILRFSATKLSSKQLGDLDTETLCKHPLAREGLEELRSILGLLPPSALESLSFDASLARGLDYYTGLIFEFDLEQFPEQGSVASGGRYDNLVSEFIDKKLPGVGGSIGLSRLMDLVFSKNLGDERPRKSLALLLITVLDEGQRPHCNRLAEQARAAGVATEVFFKSPKLGKQIDYAAAKGIPYVLFLSADGRKIEVKDLISKHQTEVENFGDWCERLADSSC